MCVHTFPIHKIKTKQVLSTVTEDIGLGHTYICENNLVKHARPRILGEGSRLRVVPGKTWIRNVSLQFPNEMRHGTWGATSCYTKYTGCKLYIILHPRTVSTSPHTADWPNKKATRCNKVHWDMLPLFLLVACCSAGEYFSWDGLHPWSPGPCDSFIPLIFFYGLSSPNVSTHWFTTPLQVSSSGSMG